MPAWFPTLQKGLSESYHKTSWKISLSGIKKHWFWWLLPSSLALLKLSYFLEPSHLWDEATYALIAQEWLNGSLPYVDYWDNKPPLLFALIAVWFALFGSSILSYFSLAAVSLLINSLYLRHLLRLAPQFELRRYADFLAWLLLVASCAGLNGIYSEYFVILPILYSINVLVIKEPKSLTLGHYLLLGLALAVAVLIRLNLAYYSLMAVLAIFFQGYPWRSALIRAGLSVLAALSLLGLVVLPYLINNHIQALMQFVLTAIKFSEPQHWLAVVTGFIRLELSRENGLLLISSLVVLLTILVRSFRAQSLLTGLQQKPNPCLILLLLGLLISVFSIGVYYHHYSLHLLPLLIIGWSFGVAALSPKVAKIAMTLALLGTLTPHLNSLNFLFDQLKQLRITGTIYSDPAYQSANYLQQHCPDCSIWSNNHVLLLLLKRPPNHFLVHPSNQSSELFSQSLLAQSALVSVQSLFDPLPEIITYSTLDQPFKNNQQAHRYWLHQILPNYELAQTFGHSFIYRLKDGVREVP